jgi:hypothetical protein
MKEIIAALKVAMYATLLTALHFTTHQEKECLGAIKKWVASYKDKLNILPYETRLWMQIKYSVFF